MFSHKKKTGAYNYVYTKAICENIFSIIENRGLKLDFGIYLC